MDRTFDCGHFEKTQSAYLDGQLPSPERQQANRHLNECARCRQLVHSLSELRGALRTMPKLSPPASLSTKLRIIASREITRRADHRNWLQLRHARLRIWTENLMRPFAIPAAGGVMSAILLFCIIAPSLIVRNVARASLDVPTGLYTGASVKVVLPLGFDGEDIDVELTIDENGNMVDYSVVDDQRSGLAKSPALQRNLESHLLTMKFTPATAFGQPVGAKMRLTFRATRIDVKG